MARQTEKQKMRKIRKDEKITLWTGNIPVVRGGRNGRGRILARGTVFAGLEADAARRTVRLVLDLPDGREVYINGKGQGIIDGAEAYAEALDAAVMYDQTGGALGTPMPPEMRAEFAQKTGVEW